MGTTVSTELVHHGERRDRLGRRHVPTARRRELLALFCESGLTRQAFARQEGIRYTTFCTWVQREEKAGGRSAPAAKAAVRFAEVARPAGAARGLEVRLADGTTLRGERVEELAALVRALRG
jgi:transposase-like protein